jgi:hypothetical protein
MPYVPNGSNRNKPTNQPTDHSHSHVLQIHLQAKNKQAKAKGKAIPVTGRGGP